MTDSLKSYNSSSADWRRTLRQNTTRTRIVILLFFLIYLGIGLLVDLSIVENQYPTVPLSTLFNWLIHFKITPLATIVMLIIATISLLVSYMMYDKLMLLGTEYREITPTTAQSPAEQQLYNVIEEMKIAAGLRYMPKVFVIEADYMNAFASGYSERSAMVAITRGLMEKLDRDELTAVMAHELSHVRHLDIKLTLTASLLANLSLMVIDILFYNAIYGRRDDRSKNSLAGIIILLRYLLPVINLILILYLSRTRELMADAGCVELMRNNEPLARALLKIQDDHTANQEAYTKAYLSTPHENVRREAYFFDPLEGGIKHFTSINDIFSTHPDIATRLAALGYQKKK